MYQVSDLGVVPAGYSVPIINASGQVIQDPSSGASLMKAGSYSIDGGVNRNFDSGIQTYLYQKGALIATLSDFVGNGAYNETIGYAVNKSGMVVGSEQTGSLLGPLGVAFYFTPSGGIHPVPQLYPLSNALNAALSVNDSGMIVGFSTGPNGFGSPIRTAYLSDGQTSWDLNTLIVPGSGLTLTSASYISDSGQIAGYGVDAKGQEHLVLLTPMATPEPSAMMILAAGSLAFVAKKASRILGDKFNI